MLNLGEGTTISNFEGIFEGYERLDYPEYSFFVMNVGIEKLDQMITDFINGLSEPSFFVLEIPVNKEQEEKLRKNDNIKPFHNNIYYLDTMNIDILKNIWETYKHLLLHDGIVQFGFASHEPQEEIFVKTYKIVNFFTKNKEEAEQFMFKFGVPKIENLKTVWDNFSQENPGVTTKITMNDMDIYDLPELLKKDGLYLVQQK